MRHFTFESAKARIPELERALAHALEIHAKAEAKTQTIRRLENNGSDPAQLAIECSQLQFLVKAIREHLQQVVNLSTLPKA